jgi:predicted phage terminase large subunit-like protein
VPSPRCHLLYPRCGCQAAPKKRNIPWRTRKEAEAAAFAGLENRLVQAIEAGYAAQVLAASEIALSRVCFSKFCQLAWHVIEPSTHLEWGRHHELICTTLQALFEDWWRSKHDRHHIPSVRNTVFNCPPGSLKSKLIAVFFHAWVWIRAPGTKFVCVSVNESAAQRDARDTRALLLSDWYQANFQPAWTIKTDQDAISDFGNTAGGARLSRASGSVIVGLRGDFFLGDDLNDPEESDKELEREKVNSLWDTNQYNRVNDPLRSQRICVQQRVHVNDHTGHVIAKQGLWSPDNRNGWLLVVLPAEFEVSRAAFALPAELLPYVQSLPDHEVRDWRSEPGEALHPTRMPAKWLADEKRRWAGTSNYAGQMQQRPTAEGGGKIKRAWFNWFRLAQGVRPGIDEAETGRPRPRDCHKGDAFIVPAAHHRPGYWDFDQVVISVDPAYKKTEKGSLWGILAFGCKGARKYLLDDRSQRGEPDEAIAIMKDLVKCWSPDRILIEDKAGGAGMFRTLELAMAEGDVPMVELDLVNPGTLDKDARINAAIPALANGMLYLLEGAPWLEDYVDELALYPNGLRNDRIDATTQAVNHIRIDDYSYPTARAWSLAMAS